MATHIRGMKEWKATTGHRASLARGSWIYPLNWDIWDEGRGRPFSPAKKLSPRPVVLIRSWDEGIGEGCLVWPRSTNDRNRFDDRSIPHRAHARTHASRCKVKDDGWVVRVVHTIALAPVGDAGDPDDLWCCDEPTASSLRKEIARWARTVGI